MKIYTLKHLSGTEHEDGYVWVSDLHLDDKKVATVTARPHTKKPVDIKGSEREVARFERTATRLLPSSKTPASDLVMVLAIAQDKRITPFNRVIMVSDYRDAEPLALDPTLISPDVRTPAEEPEPKKAKKPAKKTEPSPRRKTRSV